MKLTHPVVSAFNAWAWLVSLVLPYLCGPLLLLSLATALSHSLTPLLQHRRLRLRNPHPYTHRRALPKTTPQHGWGQRTASGGKRHSSGRHNLHSSHHLRCVPGVLRITGVLACQRREEGTDKFALGNYEGWRSGKSDGAERRREFYRCGEGACIGLESLIWIRLRLGGYRMNVKFPWRDVNPFSNVLFKPQFLVD